MSTYYSQTSINGFGLAMAARYGVEVSMAGGGGARTDGSTVIMPKVSGYLTESEFECLLGQTLHELGHCKHGSVPYMKSFIDQCVITNGCSKSLAQSCYNFVIDVADDTRLIQWDAGHLTAPTSVTYDRLFMSSYDAFQKLMKSKPWEDVTKNTVWLAGVTAMYFIMGPRLPGKKLKRDDAKRLRLLCSALSDRGVAMTQLIRAVRKAKTTAKEYAESPEYRPDKEWNKISGAAEECVKILMPFDDAEGESSQPSEGQSSCKTEGVAVAPAGDVEHDGEFDEKCDAIKSDLSSCGHGGDGLGREEYGKPDAMNKRVFQRTRTMISQAISRAAEDDGGEYQHGMMSGSRVGNFHRAHTDGRVFARYQESGMEREAISAAILLDTSGSMIDTGRHVPYDIAAIAEGFRQAVISVNGEANCWAFSTDTRHYPNGFARFNFDRGGTNPKLAMLYAEKWLKTAKNLNKAMVICTDGEPSHDVRPALAATTRRLQKSGVEVIIAFYGWLGAGKLRAIETSDPKATLVNSMTLPGLAVALKKIGKRLTIH